MLIFPTTDKRALCHYPLERYRCWRLIRSESGGGIQSRRTGKGTSVRWNLSYQDLSDEEAVKLRGFHQECGGGLRPFTFVDPLANLLLNADDPTGPAWQVTESVVVLSDVLWRGCRVMELGSPGGLTQYIEAAGGIPYCASAWARSPQGGSFSMSVADNHRRWELGGSWIDWHSCCHFCEFRISGNRNCRIDG